MAKASSKKDVSNDTASGSDKTPSRKKKLLLTAIVLSVIFLAAAILIVISLSFQHKSPKETPNLSADAVVAGVVKKMNYTNLTPISKENISRYYEIPKDDVVDYAMSISGKSGTEIEITCFRFRDGASDQALMKAINEYLSEKTASSRSSSLSSSQNSTPAGQSAVASQYPYVFVAVAPDCDTAVKSFRTVLNDSLKQFASDASSKE